MSISFDEALNNYYKLKEKYETTLNNNKTEILSKYKLSWREKNREYKGLVKKCINCGQSGGTKFATLNDEEDDTRILSAVCGHVAAPCNLDIKLKMGIYESLPYYIGLQEEFIKQKKNEIINDKNKLLFGYISKEEAIQNFDAVKDELKSSGEIIENLIHKYLDIIDNKQKKEEIKSKTLMSFRHIKEIQQAISDYNSTKNKQFVKDAVDIYIDNLKPIVDQIRNLKYSSVTVEFNENDNTYHLVEQKYTIKDLEEPLIEPKIISYVVGNISIQSKKKVPKEGEERNLEGEGQGTEEQGTGEEGEEEKVEQEKQSAPPTEEGSELQEFSFEELSE